MSHLSKCLKACLETFTLLINTFLADQEAILLYLLHFKFTGVIFQSVVEINYFSCCSTEGDNISVQKRLV